MTVTDWGQLPLTLNAHHVAAIYGLKWCTVLSKIGSGEVAAPFADKPWRWRKADVKAHYERLSLHGVRRARLQQVS